MLSPPRQFVPGLWRWVLQELRNNYMRSRWKTYLCICTWEVRDTVSLCVFVSQHCCKNIHALVNTLRLFLVMSVLQSDLPHGHAKAWISIAKGHYQPEVRGWDKMGQICFHCHTSALNDHQLRATLVPPATVAVAPRFPYTRTRPSKQLLSSFCITCKEKSLCLPI